MKYLSKIAWCILFLGMCYQHYYIMNHDDGLEEMKEKHNRLNVQVQILGRRAKQEKNSEKITLSKRDLIILNRLRHIEAASQNKSEAQ